MQGAVATAFAQSTEDEDMVVDFVPLCHLQNPQFMQQLDIRLWDLVRNRKLRCFKHT